MMNRIDRPAATITFVLALASAAIALAQDITVDRLTNVWVSWHKGNPDGPIEEWLRPCALRSQLGATACADVVIESDLDVPLIVCSPDHDHCARLTELQAVMTRSAVQALAPR